MRLLTSRTVDGRLVEALSRPETYPEETAAVDVRETHMSWVFITDSHAYKLKKPLRYSYLDFRTPAARRLNCEREVRLNRRFTRDVYEGVRAVQLDGGGARIGPPSAQADDWLVVMRRLDAAATLEAGLAAGWARAEDLQPVVDVLERGYRWRPAPRVSPFGYVNRLWRQAEGDARELRRPEFGLDPEVVGRVLRAVQGYLARRASDLAARVRHRGLVEGHGDLRPEHVYLGGTTRIVDCLEFSRAFRILDPADELACLALHCEQLGGDWAREALFSRYAALTGDTPPGPLVSLYLACRGLLWAKLEIWHLERSVAEAGHWREKAGGYLAVAAREATALADAAAR